MNCFTRLIGWPIQIFIAVFLLQAHTSANADDFVLSVLHKQINTAFNSLPLQIIEPGYKQKNTGKSQELNVYPEPYSQVNGEESYELRIEKGRYIIIALGGVILIIILLFIMFYRQWQMIYHQRILSLEQRLLRSQMNPHFIFNSLMNIQNFMLSNDVKKANNYLTRFARLVRAILENSREEFIPLEEEIGMLRNYLDLQKLRHNNKLDYEISIDEHIMTEDILIPPMLTQPFVENAIEHGIMLKEGKGLVSIEICQNKEYLLVIIKDNGIGRKEAMARRETLQKTQRSLSTKITRERIELYNSKAKNKIELKISDIKDENAKTVLGTSVKLKIPLSKI